MPLILFSKIREEESAKILVTKFLDRIYINPDGTAEGVLEFILFNTEESEQAISAINILMPITIDPDGLRDISGSFTDPNLHVNKVYTNGLKCINPASKLYSIDGKEGIVEAELDKRDFLIINNADRFCNIKLNFQLPPGTTRAFRILYRALNFAQVYQSCGLLTYYFNHRSYYTKHFDVIDRYVGHAIGIDRRLCEIDITLPEEFIYHFSLPLPTFIKSDQNMDLCANTLLPSPRTSMYYDVESESFSLPGRAIPNIIKPMPGSGIRIYLEFKKPEVSLDTFSIVTDRTKEELAHIESRLSRTMEITEKLSSVLSIAENKISSILKQSKVAFVITVILSMIAIAFALLSIFRS